MLSLRRAVLRAVLAVARPRAFRVENAKAFERAASPYLIVCNHPALVDSLYLILASPRELTVCGAKPRYFDSFLKRRLMSFLRVMKVESRDQYLTDCLRLLDEGRCLLLYPEMGRNPRGMGAFETWAAELALAASAPVICCFIDGTHEGQRIAVTLYVDEPFTPTDVDAGGLTEELATRIRSLGPRPSA